MPHDPARVRETRAWLSKAATDLRAARHDLRASPPLLDVVVFHTQQAAEKALKAFLTWHDVVFRKTHNLEELGEQCLAFDPSLKEIIDRAVPLTEYAWQYRYPGDQLEPSEEEATGAVDLATEVMEAVLQRLPVEVRP